MSFDDGFLGELAETIAKVGLQVVFIRNSAALLPILKQALEVRKTVAKIKRKNQHK